MSSEYSIHLHDREIKGHVYSLGRGDTVMVTVEVGPSDGLSEDMLKLFVAADREQEVAFLFYRIARALGALAVTSTPEVDTIPAEDAAESLDPQGHRWG